MSTPNFKINRAIALKIGLVLFDGAVTKTVGAEWVRVVPSRNFDPMNNLADAQEALAMLAAQGSDENEEHY